MSFTPLSALVGGALIGSSASLLLVLDGRVAGISGIVGGLLQPKRGEIAWRSAFLVGLLLGALGLALLYPAAVHGVSPVPLALVVLAGVLVGFGTRLGSGCTSGHGVCGISRGSKRSIVATMTFMATGVATTFVVQHLLFRGAP